MPNKWIEFVKEFSRKHDISYACAVSTPLCKAQYRAKYGNRKKLPIRKEKELMSMEDKNVGKKSKKIKAKLPREALERALMEDEDVNRILPKSRINLSELIQKKEQMNMKKQDVNRASKVYKIINKDKDKLTSFFEEHFEKENDTESDTGSDSESESSIESENDNVITVQDPKTKKEIDYTETDYRKLMTKKRINEDDKLFLLAKLLDRKKMLKLVLI